MCKKLLKFGFLVHLKNLKNMIYKNVKGTEGTKGTRMDINITWMQSFQNSLIDIILSFGYRNKNLINSFSVANTKNAIRTIKDIKFLALTLTDAGPQNRPFSGLGVDLIPFQIFNLSPEGNLYIKTYLRVKTRRYKDIWTPCGNF